MCYLIPQRKSTLYPVMKDRYQNILSMLEAVHTYLATPARTIIDRHGPGVPEEPEPPVP